MQPWMAKPPDCSSSDLPESAHGELVEVSLPAGRQRSEGQGRTAHEHGPDEHFFLGQRAMAGQQALDLNMSQQL